MLHNIKFWGLCFLLLSCFSMAQASCEFEKDELLVEKIKENQIRIIALRHQESLNNFQDIVTSSRSPGYSLTSAGLEEVRAVSEELKRFAIEILYTSPLYRSLQASEIIGSILAFTPEKMVTQELLAIQKFGSYEGRIFEDYESLFPSFTDMLEGNAPGGEKGIRVFNRTRKALWALVDGPEKNVLIVTHAFNICHIRMCLTGSFGDLPQMGEYVVFDSSNL